MKIINIFQIIKHYNLPVFSLFIITLHEENLDQKGKNNYSHMAKKVEWNYFYNYLQKQNIVRRQYTNNL